MLELKPKGCLGIPIHQQAPGFVRQDQVESFGSSHSVPALDFWCSPYGPMVVIIPISHKMSHKHPEMVPNMCKPPTQSWFFWAVFNSVSYWGEV